MNFSRVFYLRGIAQIDTIYKKIEKLYFYKRIYNFCKTLSQKRKKMLKFKMLIWARIKEIRRSELKCQQ